MNTDRKTQVRKNISMNMAYFITNVALGLWLVPYLVKNLGVSAYGLVPLAMIFSQYISVMTQSFNSAVNRFLAIELQKNNIRTSLKIFNTSIVILLGFLMIKIILMTFIIYNLKSIINIPDGIYNDTIFLFCFSFLGFIFSLFSSIFSISMYSQNRLDLMRINDILQVCTRIGSIIALFMLFGPSLACVGIGNLLGGVAVFCLSFFRCRTLAPDLKFDLRCVDLARIWPIAAMAGWVLINQVGYLLFLRIDIYVVNRFIGAESGGEYAAVLQWSQLVRAAAGVLAGAITPLAMIYYARGEMESLIRMMKLAVKSMCLALAIPLGMLCAFSENILTVWIGKDFARLGSLMALQLFSLVVNLGILPLFSVSVSLNRVKIPAITSCVTGVINLILAILLVKYTGFGYYGIAFAGIIALTLKNAVFTPLYTAKILNLPIATFFKPIQNGTLTFIAIYILSKSLRYLYSFESAATIAFALVIIFSVSILPIVWVNFSSAEKYTLVDFIPQAGKKFSKRLLFVR